MSKAFNNNMEKENKSPNEKSIKIKKPKKTSSKQSKSKMRQFAEREFPIPSWMVMVFGSILVTLIVESLSRRSIGGAFNFIANNPLAFVMNCSLIAFSISIALFFKRRVFAIALAESIWILLALANYTVMSRRGRLALYPADLHGITEGVIVIPKLFTWWQVALIAGVATLAVAGLVVLLLRTKKYRRNLNNSFLRLVSAAFIFTLTLLLCLENNFITRSLRPDFYAAYKKNGFSYSFVFGLFDTRMTEPEAYNDTAVKTIQDKTAALPTATPAPKKTNADEALSEKGTNAERLGIISKDTDLEGYGADLAGLIDADKTPTVGEEDYPNIIILQLEAFCDPQKLTEYEYEGEPIPTFTSLCENYTSGVLYVPTVAGGTCNTEFEVLTGCNLDLFGANEYPYYNLVRYNEFESIAHDLKPFGYTSTFLHNYSGTFYNRNLVYSNLGFDKFASIEYMNGYEENEKGWAKDKVLKRYILDSLESTNGKDLIMAVGVQTHSSYPELIDEEAPFAVTKAPDDSENDRLSFQYYLSQMNEVDAFLAELVEALSAYDEKTILIVYGDHLPGLKFNHDVMTTEELFSTSYVLWSNYELEKADRDLEAYQLLSYALMQAGIRDTGAMVTIHQTFMDDEYDYMNKMTLIQYDITYGSHFWYGEKTIARTEPMEFGVTPIQIEACHNDPAGNLFIYGTGFTRDAEIYINDRAQNTIFIDENLMIVQGEALGESDKVDIRFFGEDGLLMSIHSPNEQSEP